MFAFASVKKEDEEGELESEKVPSSSFKIKFQKKVSDDLKARNELKDKEQLGSDDKEQKRKD